MKIVKKKDYYHIQKDSYPHKWKIGENFFIGYQNNNYAKVFSKTEFLYKIEAGERIQILHIFRQIISSIKKENVSEIDLNKIRELIKFSEIFALDTLKIHRENIFEEIRLGFFPNLPSRKRGIWLIPFNKESLDYWVKRMPKGNIFQIKATGKVHNSSEKFLSIGNYTSLDYIRQAAFLYWAGVERESKEDEIIFEGFIEVIQEIK